jgi:hypothetical protein
VTYQQQRGELSPEDREYVEGQINASSLELMRAAREASQLTGLPLGEVVDELVDEVRTRTHRWFSRG